MTRAEYTKLAHQLCAVVNARRARRGKEPLREHHIMRVIRLTMGPGPSLVYPAKNPEWRPNKPPKRSPKRDRWALAYLERVRDG
jgi:hypothetical protein